MKLSQIFALIFALVFFILGGCSLYVFIEKVISLGFQTYEQPVFYLRLAAFTLICFGLGLLILLFGYRKETT